MDAKTKEKKQKIQWDEETIAAHDKERGSRQKIDEAPTPYRYYSESDQSECESEGESLGANSGEEDMHNRGNSSGLSQQEEKKRVNFNSPSSQASMVSDSWETINARLQYEKHLQDLKDQGIDPSTLNAPRRALGSPSLGANTPAISDSTHACGSDIHQAIESGVSTGTGHYKHSTKPEQTCYSSQRMVNSHEHGLLLSPRSHDAPWKHPATLPSPVCPSVSNLQIPPPPPSPPHLDDQHIGCGEESMSIDGTAHDNIYAGDGTSRNSGEHAALSGAQEASERSSGAAIPRHLLPHNHHHHPPGKNPHPAPAAYSPFFTRKQFSKSSGGDSSGSGSGSGQGSGSSSSRRTKSVHIKTQGGEALSPGAPLPSVPPVLFRNTSGNGSNGGSTSGSVNTNDRLFAGINGSIGGGDEDRAPASTPPVTRPARSREQFRNKRAGHYNEFKVLQAMRAKLAAEEAEDEAEEAEAEEAAVAAAVAVVDGGSLGTHYSDPTSTAIAAAEREAQEAAAAQEGGEDLNAVGDTTR